MKKIHLFSKGVIVVSASISSAITPIISSSLLPTFNVGVGAILVFVAAMLVFSLLQIFIDKIMDRSTFVRRIVLGDDFIEGYWIDVSRGKEGKLIGVSLLNIHFKDERLDIEGTSLRIADKVTANWGVKFAAFEANTLSYFFESHTNNSEKPVEVGYGQLRLGRDDDTSKSYTGFYYNTSMAEVVAVSGRKIKDSKVISTLKDPEQKFACLREALVKAYEGDDGYWPQKK